MDPFKINPRRLRLLRRFLKGMKYNKETLYFFKNHLRWRMLNRQTTLRVPYPTNMMLELSARCNLHCIMCAREFAYGQAMDQGFMPLDKAKMIIDKVIPYLTSIGLTGLGETFLYPHLEEICRYIKKRKPNIIITLSTNAHFKGYTEIIDRIIPFIDNLQVSVDGIGEIYEKIRPNTDFSFIAKNIRYTAEKCKKYGVELKLNLVLMPQNIHNLKDVIDFAKDVGVGSVEMNPMNIASNPGMNRVFYGFFVSDEYRRICEQTRLYAKERGMELSLLPFQEKPNFQDCPFPWEHPYITWNGYFVPCCGKPFPKLLNFGNVFEADDLMDIINGAKAQEFRKQWQQQKAPRFCHNCSYVDF